MGYNNRRKHGCDKCHKDVPTERFEGYCGNLLWICDKCFKLMTKIKKENDKHENKSKSTK